MEVNGVSVIFSGGVMGKVFHLMKSTLLIISSSLRVPTRNCPITYSQTNIFLFISDAVSSPPD